MKFEELKKLVYDLLDQTIERKDFHRHPNGNGWVANTAQVGETAFVGEDASVFNHAQVKENARICDKAVILDHALVSGHACISGQAILFDNAIVIDYAIISQNAIIGGSAYIGEKAKIRGYAQVFENAKVFGSALIHDSANVSGSAKIGDRVTVICGDAWVKGNAEINGVYVAGLEWVESPILYKLGHISINQSAAGCTSVNFKSHPHQIWLGEEGEKLLKKMISTDSEIAECRKYVQTIMEAERNNQKITDCQKISPPKPTQSVGMKMG